MNETSLIPQDLLQAAGELGAALRQSPVMLTYLEACAAVQSDPRANGLEAEVAALADELTQRQANGEMIGSGELERFYRLRSEVRSHPLLAERDRQFELVRATLGRVNDDVSAAIGMNFSELTRPG